MRDMVKKRANDRKRYHDALMSDAPISESITLQIVSESFTDDESAAR